MDFRTTHVGPHRDDYEITLNGQLSRNMNSRGEIRLMMIALKIYQYNKIYSVYKKYPVMLIDDIFVELDNKRKKNFINFIKKLEQVFITSAEEFSIDFSDYRVYKIRKV